MAEESPRDAGPDTIDMFDESTDVGVVCRVCGSLVAPTDEYRQAHWAWHEAPNGA